MTPKGNIKPIGDLNELAYIICICIFTALAIIINT